MKSLTIELPMPPPILSPNGPTWGKRTQMVKSKAKKSQRETTKLAALAVLNGATPPRWKYAKISAAFWPASWAGLGSDPMNRIAMLKGAVDGLEDAGIFENDRGVQWGPVTHPGIDAVTPHVVLTIEELAAGEGVGNA